MKSIAVASDACAARPAPTLSRTTRVLMCATHLRLRAGPSAVCISFVLEPSRHTQVNGRVGWRCRLVGGFGTVKMVRWVNKDGALVRSWGQ